MSQRSEIAFTPKGVSYMNFTFVLPTSFVIIFNG